MSYYQLVEEMRDKQVADSDARKELKKDPTVLKVLNYYLKSEGFDGLWNFPDGCGCPVNDLSPGNCVTEFCRAGVRVECFGRDDIDDPCDPGSKCCGHIVEAL